MVFAVISKFNAELVKKKFKLLFKGNVKYKLFKHSRASNSKANSSDSLCLS